MTNLANTFQSDCSLDLQGNFQLMPATNNIVIKGLLSTARLTGIPENQHQSSDYAGVSVTGYRNDLSSIFFSHCYGKQSLHFSLVTWIYNEQTYRCVEKVGAPKKDYRPNWRRLSHSIFMNIDHLHGFVRASHRPGAME